MIQEYRKVGAYQKLTSKMRTLIVDPLPICRNIYIDLLSRTYFFLLLLLFFFFFFFCFFPRDIRKIGDYSRFSASIASSILLHCALPHIACHAAGYVVHALLAHPTQWQRVKPGLF